MDPKIQDTLTKTRIKLFKRELHFFGIIAAKYTMSVHEFKENLEGVQGYVVLLPEENKSGNECPDNAIHINEEFLKKDDYTHLHAVYLILHEMLHILNRHGVRGKGKHAKLWNMATDHVINTFINRLDKQTLEEVKVNIAKPYQQPFIVPELEDKQELSAEDVYNWLLKNKVRYEVTMNPDGSMTVKDNKTGKSSVVNPNMGGCDQDDSSSGINNDLARAIENAISNARSAHEICKTRGFTSGALISYLDDLLKIVIPWQQLLEIAIKTNVHLCTENQSWKIPNRFMRHHRILLPGKIPMEDKEGVGMLIVHVDTSGSISDDDLKEASDVIIQSMDHFKTIKLITADVNVHQEVDFDSDNIDEFVNYIKKDGYKGRGGTSHEPTFKRIDEIWEEYIDDLSLIISITDGYSDIENIYQNFRFVRNNVPMVFLISSDYDLKLDFKRYHAIRSIYMHDDDKNMKNKK
jgi:predicted metal-dependent peptidase